MVDDGSSDGSWEELQRVAAEDPRIRAFRHDRNRGKGAAIRTAIAQMTGDVAVVQDADLEYDPNDYLRLLGRPSATGGPTPSSAPASPARRTASSTSGTAWATSSSPCSPTWPTTSTSPTWRRVTRWCAPTCSASFASAATPSPWSRKSPAAWPNGAHGSTKCPSATPAAPTWKERRSRPSTASRSSGSCSAAAGSTRSSPHHRGFYVLKSIARARKFNRWLLAECGPWLGHRHPGGRRGHRQPQRALVGPLAAGPGGPRPHVRRPLARPVRPARQRPRDPGRPDQARGRRPLEGRADRHRPVLRRPGAPRSRRGGAAVVARRACSPAAIASSSCRRKCRLYNALDRQQGHQRRYARGGTPREDGARGLRGRLLPQRGQTGIAGSGGSRAACSAAAGSSPRQIVWADRLFPLTRLLDFACRWPGATSIMVGRRREKS